MTTLDRCFHYGSLSFKEQKRELQKNNLCKINLMFPQYQDYISEYISNSEFLAENSSLLVKFALEASSPNSTFFDDPEAWRERTRNTIRFHRLHQSIKVTGIYGSFPLYINKFSEIEVWNHLARNLKINDYIEKEIEAIIQ